MIKLNAQHNETVKNYIESYRVYAGWVNSLPDRQSVDPLFENDPNGIPVYTLFDNDQRHDQKLSLLDKVKRFL